MTEPKKPVDMRNPTLAAYAEGMMARNAERKRGAPTGVIPRLDSPIPDSSSRGPMTFADVARAQKAVVQGIPESVIKNPAAGSGLAYLNPDPPPAPAPPPSPLGGSAFRIGPNDRIPDAARRDPLFRSGIADVLAINQHPDLIRKYGVIRDGNLIQVDSPRSGGGGPGVLSPQTREALDAVAAASARVMADAGPPPPVSDKDPQKKAEGKEYTDPLDNATIERGLNRLDNLFGLEQAIKEDLLNNEEQRGIIEGRLAPLSLSELLMQGRVVQDVPIVPGVFEGYYESYSLSADLELEDILAELEMQRRKEGKPIHGLQRRKWALSLTMSLRGFKAGDYTHIFGGIYSNKGEVDPAKFWDKFASIARINYHTFESLMVNALWFDLRVRRLHLAVGPS